MNTSIPASGVAVHQGAAASSSQPPQATDPVTPVLARAIAALRAGEPARPLPLLADLAQRHPKDARIPKVQAVCQRAAGQIREAVASGQRATALAPEDSELHYNLGNALRELRRLDQAALSYRRALRLKDEPMALGNLALCLNDMGRRRTAIAVLRRGCRRFPDHAGLAAQLGRLLGMEGKAHLEAALASHHRAATLEPERAGHWVDMAILLRRHGRYEDSLAAAERAAVLAPEDAEVQAGIGNSLIAFGRFQEAEAAYARAAALDPDNLNLRLGRANLRLRQGLYTAQAWDDYGQRWRLPDLEAGQRPQPQWQGEPLWGKWLLIHGEQGYGDTLLAARYVPLLKAMGAGVLASVSRPLQRLFRGGAGIDGVTGEGLPPLRPDWHCSAMDLPALLGTEWESVPPPLPFAVPAAAMERMAPPIQKAGAGLRVGIIWSGNPAFTSNPVRAAPLARFLELGEIESVRLFSLQMGPGRQELDWPENRDRIGRLVDLTTTIEDFADSAAALCLLDLVVMTDTAVAHLAGSLGRPVWNLLDSNAYWLYGTRGETTPWYPSMRLFRQPKPKDWDSVFATVKEALARKAAAYRRRPG